MRSGLLVLLLWLSQAAIAATRKEPTGIGGMAINMMEPVTFFSDFIYTACFVIGGSFVFASVVKYFEHKRSPLAVTMSTVVFLLIAGLFLISLPFAYLLVHHGSPYTLLK